MVDNNVEDTYFYKISVVTGMGRAAGTQSNVYCILAGEEAKTGVKAMKDSSNIVSNIFIEALLWNKMSYYNEYLKFRFKSVGG